MSAEAVRFFSKVKRSENGCWIWIGGKQHKYGAFRISTKKTCRAHRWMYEWFWGAIPKGHVVMHTCDNPACVCPYHLVAGTQDENNRDCSRKGRSKHFKENGFFGEAHKMAKLTESEVKKSDRLAILKISKKQPISSESVEPRSATYSNEKFGNTSNEKAFQLGFCLHEYG